MAKPAKYRKISPPAVRPIQMIGLIIRGLLVGLCISLFFTLLFSLVTLASDTVYISQYTHHIMVAVNIVSIFIGSVYASRKAQSKILLVGITVGVLYVFFSILVGMQLNGETIALSVFLNKIFTGIAAGALGGVIGLHLS
ncbi:TIGR04086 family membrane protein [Acetonema longum]|uniref:Uncharacterized protein n=1 Tax=Acetonema longum DSM 6540 TaxID=1009370 RepID=F7NPB5_9FIRM|nr:TIGR04086 family membrane protein [Acetonema longum]EGO62077.1 hypothetical protein ALO_19792 [Acetonema longum DSM 6540]